MSSAGRRWVCSSQWQGSLVLHFFLFIYLFWTKTSLDHWKLKRGPLGISHVSFQWLLSFWVSFWGYFASFCRHSVFLWFYALLLSRSRPCVIIMCLFVVLLSLFMNRFQFSGWFTASSNNFCHRGPLGPPWAPGPSCIFSFTIQGSVGGIKLIKLVGGPTGGLMAADIRDCS